MGGNAAAMDEEQDRAGQTDADERSLLEDVQTLLEDGRVAVQAEINFQQTRLAYCGKAARNLVIFAVAGLLFSFFTLIALTVGLLLALIPAVTAWGATGIVTGVFVVALAVCLGGALSSWRKIRAAMKGPQA